MTRLPAPKAAHWIVSRLEEAGYETWAVGGAVRDAVSGLSSYDWDFTTAARPSQVKKVFPRTVPIGLEHGTVGVLFRDGTLYEVTTFRKDVRTTGRHAEVAFADTLDEDLARRDFTINAVAWHPVREVVHDPFGGREDMARRVLRTVGDPSRRFAEDYLRVLRALRFAGTFRLDIEADTWRALVRAVENLGVLSSERLHEELQRILAGVAPPSRSLALYAASGVARSLFPELDRTVGCVREPGVEWFAHALETVDRIARVRPDLRWAALFQGVGEAAGHGEDEAGATPPTLTLLRAAAVLERLRASNARIREIAEVAALSSRPPAPEASDAELRRWLASAGRARLGSVLRIWSASVRADEARGRAGQGAHGRHGFTILATRLRRLARSDAPLRVEELDFSGRDLIRMGFAPGPHFGEVLRSLLDLALDDPSLNRRDSLRVEAERWLEARGIAPRTTPG